MSSNNVNTLILVVMTALVAGAGLYVTRKVQPEELARLKAEEEAIRLSEAEVETLLADEALASAAATEALTRWNARYKVLPTELTSPEVVAYLNALSSVGFRQFDITLGGVSPRGTHSVYTYNVTGQAFFESLYGFIWHVENGRGMYRVRDVQITKSVANRVDPETGVERMEILAEFSLSVDAYFAGADGMSAPDSLMAVPAAAFPPRRPYANLFYPYILEQLPPNSGDLVDVEVDSLVSVIGGTAVFLRGEELRQLGEGDRVYLGRVTSVDARRAVVVVDLNKGGIRERIELALGTGERYRQALGSATLTRARGPVLDVAPPQPGTPDAIRRGTYRPAPLSGDAALPPTD